MRYWNTPNAAGVPSTASGNLSSTTVQTALDELQSDIDSRAVITSGTNTTMVATTGAEGQIFYNTTYKHHFIWRTDRWWPNGSPDPRYGFQIYDEFLSSGLPSQLDWVGAGTVNVSAGNATNPGLFSITQSTAASRSALFLATSPLLFGSADFYWESLVSIPTLATGSEDFVAEFGILDNTTYDSGGAATDGAFFRYNRAVNGANWQCVTSSNTSATITNTNTAISAGTYYRLGIQVTGSSSVTFYVNGALVATISTNIPSGASRQTGFVYKVDKTLGTAASSANVDYFACYGFFSSARVS